MVNLLLIFIIQFITTPNTYRQCYNTENCEKVIIDSHKFDTAQTDHFYFGLSQSGIIKNILDINDYPEFDKIIKVEENCLKFMIFYGCGCGEIKYNLYSNGIVETDEYGSNYVKVKLEFIDDDLCERNCYKRLSFDLSALVEKPYSADYILFENVIKPIKIK